MLSGAVLITFAVFSFPSIGGSVVTVLAVICGVLFCAVGGVAHAYLTATLPIGSVATERRRSH